MGTAARQDLDQGGSDPSRPHLLLCGWYRPGTGFTRVLQALLPSLRSAFRVSWLGVGYQGPECTLDDGVRLLPTNLRGGDLVGAYAARLNAPQWRPDALLALNDIWYLAHYAREWALPGAPRLPLLGYLPLDGAIDDPAVVRDLRGFHTLVTYTHWAAGQLESALRQQGIASKVCVAGHGVDLHAFHPLPGNDDTLSQRMQRAQQLFDLEQPAFVVLNASRPDPRKRLDLTLEAFARFAAGKPPWVRLCLHQAIAHDGFVAPLREQAQQLGITERLLWFPRTPGPLDDAGLNVLYNACAVGLNTSLGEGFGLVSFEHAATGAPQVLPDHPALRELWHDHAELVTTRPIRTEHSPLRMGEVSVEATAAALQRLYDDPIHYQRMAGAARTRCGMADLDWAVPAQQLIAALMDALPA